MRVNFYHVKEIKTMIWSKHNQDLVGIQYYFINSFWDKYLSCFFITFPTNFILRLYNTQFASPNKSCLTPCPLVMSLQFTNFSVPNRLNLINWLVVIQHKFPYFLKPKFLISCKNFFLDFRFLKRIKTIQVWINK